MCVVEQCCKQGAEEVMGEGFFMALRSIQNDKGGEVRIRGLPRPTARNDSSGERIATPDGPQ